jgi:hypothetical protein
MVLDSANANVYVDGRNEITYLPREIEIIARLGEVCTSVGATCQQEADAIERQYRGNPPAGYGTQTRAGRLVSLLVTGTPLHALPLEEAFREAAAWDENKEDERTRLADRLAKNPAAIEASFRRVSGILGELADEFVAIDAALNDGAIDVIQTAIVTAIATAEAAARSAKDEFADEPVPSTGVGSWELMYKFARAFAAESGLKAAGQPLSRAIPAQPASRRLMRRRRKG